MPSERKQLNFRPVDEFWELLAALQDATGESAPALIYRGLRLVARQEGIPVPKKTSERIQNRD